MTTNGNFIRRLTLPSAAALSVFLLSTPRANAFEDTAPPLRLTIVGDSTVANYAANSPIHGWGEFVAPRLRRRVKVSNVSVPGASSTSFLRENHWQTALRAKPKVVLIQFGHNDSHQAIRPQQTEANLQFFVESARAQGATPILVTPMQLLVFRSGKFVPSLQLQAEAARQVAARTGVTLVDLHALSGRLYETLGPARAEQLASPGGDRTHFNRLGAQAMAEIILRELAQTRTPLTREILEPRSASPPATPARLPKPKLPPQARLAFTWAAPTPARSGFSL